MIWIPCSAIAICVFFEKNNATWDLLVVFCLMAIQPVMTFGMILTKEDTRKYIMDLITLSYCRKEKADTRRTLNGHGGKTSTLNTAPSCHKTDGDGHGDGDDDSLEEGEDIEADFHEPNKSTVGATLDAYGQVRMSKSNKSRMSKAVEASVEFMIGQPEL